MLLTTSIGAKVKTPDGTGTLAWMMMGSAGVDLDSGGTWSGEQKHVKLIRSENPLPESPAEAMASTDTEHAD